MLRLCLLLLVAAGFAWSAGPPKPEPLPDGAIQRLGTARFRHGGLVRHLAFSGDGRNLTSVSDDRTTSDWEVPSGRERGRIRWKVGMDITAAADSYSPRWSAIGMSDGTVRLDSLIMHGRVEMLRFSKEPITTMAFSPDGERLAVGGDDGVTRVIDPHTKKQVFTIPQERSIRCLAWSPDGKYLATNADKATLALWEAKTGKIVRFLGEEPLQCFAFSPTGKLVVTREHAGLFRLWDVEAGKELRRWSGNPDTGGSASMIYQIAFSPDGNSVFAGNLRGEIEHWDVASGTLKRLLKGRHQGRVTAVALSPKGDVLASGGADHTIHLWNTTTGEPLTPPHTVIPWPVGPHPQLPPDVDNPIRALTATSDGKTLFTIHRDGSLWMRDSTGKRRRQLSSDLVLGEPVVSNDGSLVAVVGREALVRLWNTKTGRAGEPLGGHRGGTLAAAFSADGQWLATGGRDDTVRLWPLDATKPSRVVTKHEAAVSAVALSADGRRIASGTVRGDVRVSDAQTGATVAEFTGHRGAVTKLAFDKDGKTLLSSAKDTTILKWAVKKD